MSKTTVVPQFYLSRLTYEVTDGKLICDYASSRIQGRAGETAQRLRALTGLPEVLSSIPSNYMVAHNHL